MVRYYLLSVFIHIFILFSFIESLPDNPQNLSEEITDDKTSKTDKKNSADKIKNIIEEDYQEGQRKRDEIFKLVNKHRPELDKEKIKSFSDLIISSKIERTELREITEDNLASRLRDYSAEETEMLQKELDNYLEQNRTGAPGKQNSENYTADPRNNRNENSNSGNRSGSGGIAQNLKDEIIYRGHNINNSLPDHTVSSTENRDLQNRNLTDLQINEKITQDNTKNLLSDIINQKPSKYAILPEGPVQTSEQLKRSQNTFFNSLKIGYAPRMNDKFVADGNLDEWDLSQPMTPLYIKDKRSFSAKIYLSWDLENIYLAAKVVDRYPVEPRGDWWTTNSVEVWFDILNNKNYQSFDGDDFQFWFAPFRPWFGKALGSHRFLSRSIPNHIKKTSDGYIVEAAFNQNEELRYLRSYLGKTIGFHFFVNTSIKAEDGYEERLFWVTDKYLSGNVHTYTWNNPNSWGDVIFMGCTARIALEDKTGRVEYNHFGINEWNYISVYDADRNLDPKTKQFLKIIVHSKKTDDLEEITLTESEINSGKFTGKLFSTSELARENDGFLQTTSGAAVDIYYNDQYTPNGYSSLITKTYFTYYPVMLLSKTEEKKNEK